MVGDVAATAFDGTVSKKFGATTVGCKDTRSHILERPAMQLAGNRDTTSLQWLQTQRVVQTTTRTGICKATRPLDSGG